MHLSYVLHLQVLHFGKARIRGCKGGESCLGQGGLVPRSPFWLRTKLTSFLTLEATFMSYLRFKPRLLFLLLHICSA